jgi:hypothetical protein
MKSTPEQARDMRLDGRMSGKSTDVLHERPPMQRAGRTARQSLNDSIRPMEPATRARTVARASG